MKKFINCTPHAIVVDVKGTKTTYPASGNVARVGVTQTDYDQDGVATQQFGVLENVPAPAEDTLYIVSAMVLGNAKGRTDLVAPDTAHALRDDAGHIVAVPGFIRY